MRKFEPFDCRIELYKNERGNSMKIHDLMDRYLSVIKRQHSDGTYRFYVSHLNHFKRWLEKRAIFYVSEIEYHVIDDYIADMKKTAKNATINKRVGILKRMYREMRIDFDYLQAIGKLKEQKKTFNALNRAQYIELRNYIKKYPESLTNGIYHKCFLALLADTGARVQEIMFIEKKYVNLESKEILLTHTKTKEERTVFFTENLTLPIIRKMLQVKHDHKYLLHNIEKNRPAIYEDIRYILRQVKAKLGIKKIHSHMLRHTLATYLIESGADLTSLMKILGHRNLSTTERYLHVSNKHVRKVYETKMKDFNN